MHLLFFVTLQIEKEGEKKDCKKTKSLHSQFVCIFLVPDCSFHSFLSWCLTLAAVCVQGDLWAGGGCGVVPPPAHCTPFLQEYFGVYCLLTLLEIGFVGCELPLWRIPATGGGFLNG